MKSKIFFSTSLLIVIILSSCSKSYVQVFDTATTNTQVKDDCFIYETDSLKITYSFWASKGVMSFAVYNKLDKPLYIDWKNSSFICNDNKFNYWIDEMKTNSTSYYGGYSYNGPLLRPGSTISETIQNSSSSSIKPEKVVNIPPKSNCYGAQQFYLLPIQYYPLNSDCKKDVVLRNDNLKTKTTVSSQEFSISNTPLRFRNYLAFSYTENTQQYFFIDNEFYLTHVKSMEPKHFYGKSIGVGKNGNKLYRSEYTKMTSFYIQVTN